MNPEDLAAERFKPIRRAREQIAKTEAAHARAIGRLEELRGQLAGAEHRDRKALAAALVGGRKDPESEAEEVRREIVQQELRAEALRVAVDDARAEIPALVEDNRASWRAQAMRTLAAARGRYQAAIAELEAARDSLGNEATLVAWISSGALEDAAMDLLGGRATAIAGRKRVSFSRTLAELRRDCEQLAEHPVTRDEPMPEPRLEMATGGGSKWWG